MPELEFSVDGSFNSTEAWLKKLLNGSPQAAFDKAGRQGVAALRSATPVDTGDTANSWGYEVSQNGSSWTLTFFNTNVHDGANIAILIDAGHGTRTGGYVRGKKYIRKSLDPIFNQLINDLLKAVTA